MIPRWLDRLRRLPARDRRLLVRSVVVLWAARLALWILPVQKTRRFLALRRRGTTPVPSERIGWALSHAKRVVPAASCLPQALAAETLLVRAGHVADLRIGVRKTGRDTIEAHAWVEVNGRIVVGELPPGLSDFTPLPPLPGPGG